MERVGHLTELVRIERWRSLLPRTPDPEVAAAEGVAPHLRSKGWLRRNVLPLLPHDLRRQVYRLAKPGYFGQLQGLRLHEATPDAGYSYRSFDETQSIFVHIPKAAGVSICLSLYGHLAGGHTRIADYEVTFPRECFNSYFKFTFVRNPWDRIFSAYHFLKRGGMTAEDRRWSEEILSAVPSFRDFLLGWLDESKLCSIVHLVPQIEFMRAYNGKTVPLDFIGLYENIASDFDRVRVMVSGATRLMHVNRTNADEGKRDYRNQFDAEMIQMVAKLYAEDIRYLRYTFDNSELAQQVMLREQGELLSGWPKRPRFNRGG